MFVCIKQHLSNIWTSIHEKVKQNWDWVEKSVAFQKQYLIFIKKDDLCHNKSKFKTNGPCV